MSDRAERLRLLALLALAAVLRLWALDQVPRGFFFDESVLVVEARCLRETGHDLRGNAWPFFVRALDDWKDPLLVWGTALTGPLLGDDVRGARRYLALVGIAAVAATWWLGRELFGRRSSAPLLAAGLLALSPWHLQFSRIAWQAGTLVLVQTLALAALLRADRLARTRPARAPLAFALGGALWGLVLWTYSPAKLWVPMLGAVFVGLAALRDRRWPWSGGATLAALLGFGLTAAPFLVAYLGHREAIDLRLRELSVLAGPRPVEAVLRGYSSHLSFGFLVREGDPNQRHSPPDVGQLLYAELPLVLVGLWALGRRARTPSAPQDAFGPRLLLAWLFLAPLLGAFTKEAPHAARTIAALPAVQLVAAAGALALVRAAASRRGAALALQLCLTASAVVAVRAVVVNAPRRTIDPSWWRPELRRVVDRAVELAAGQPVASAASGPAIVFLPETGVTWSDWLYLRDVPPSVLQAHAAGTRGDELRYDPFDRDGKFWFAGAAFPVPGGRPAPLAPGTVVVEGPGDKAPPGARLLGVDTAARYWQVR